MKRPKVILVKKREMKELTGEEYVGFSQYRNGKIYIQKGLSKKQKAMTIAHEMAHHKLRRLKTKFPQRVIKELKKTEAWKQFKKEGYKTKKIPEEIFAEAHAAIKTKSLSKKRLKEWKKESPHTYKKFSKLIKKRI